MNKQFMLKDVSGRDIVTVVGGYHVQMLYQGREIWDDAYDEYTTAWAEIDALDVGGEWFDSEDNIRITRVK